MSVKYEMINVNGKNLAFPKSLLQAMPMYSEIYNKYLNQHQCNIIWDKAPFKIVQGVRQSGKTRIIETLAILHAVMNHYKTIFITAHKKQWSYSIGQDIRELYNSLPNPKPKITACNSDRIEFDNGSQIITSIATENSSRGLPIDLLLMDEAAFYNENEVKAFWESLANGRMVKEIVIVSTRKNRSKKNFFWRMWIGAIEGTNGFKPFKISNKDCSNIRDSKWVKEMKNILGRAKYDHEYTIRTK